MTRSTSFFMLATVIVVAALTRLIPHWPNFTPIMAMALIGGTYAGSKLKAYAVPILAMVLSDLLLGLVFGWNYLFHDTQVWVYLSVIAITALGRLFAKKSTVSTIFIGGTAASVLFFLVTNAAVWFTGTMYPHTFEGLMMSYAAGLAFYKGSGNYLVNGIVSTWLYSSAIVFVLTISSQWKQRHALLSAK